MRGMLGTTAHMSSQAGNQGLSRLKCMLTSASCRVWMMQVAPQPWSDPNAAASARLKLAAAFAKLKLQPGRLCLSHKDLPMTRICAQHACCSCFTNRVHAMHMMCKHGKRRK